LIVFDICLATHNISSPGRNAYIKLSMKNK
jgi:hypothetical protein